MEEVAGRWTVVYDKNGETIGAMKQKGDLKMKDKKLIDLLIEICKEKKRLLYDSSLIKSLEELDNETIIQYLKNEQRND